MKKYPGSCLCKTVTFEIIGEFTAFFLCHCSRCRKETGSAHAANLFSKTGELQWLSGHDSIRSYHLPDTRFVKTFCGSCGSALPTASNSRIVVPAGSLDCDVDIQATAHIFSASKANWDNNLEHVIRYKTLPPRT